MSLNWEGCFGGFPFVELCVAPYVRGCVAGGAAKPRPRSACCLIGKRKSGRWESGKPAFGFPLSHPPSSSALWECGNPACRWRDFQGARGKRGKPAFGFPRFPQRSHFHGACVSRFAAPLQQLQLDFLHPSCRLRVAHCRGLPLQHPRGDPGLQALLPSR